ARTLLGVASLGAAAVIASELAPANASGILLAAGGLAWGAFAAVTVPVVFPPLVGLGRVDSTELGRMLAAWCALAVLRAIAVALIYAPIVLALVVAPELGVVGEAIGSDAVWLGLALPLALLAWRQWVRLALAVLAGWLDAALIDPAVDAAAWQDAVRGYLVGYLPRTW